MGKHNILIYSPSEGDPVVVTELQAKELGYTLEQIKLAGDSVTSIVQAVGFDEDWTSDDYESDVVEGCYEDNDDSEEFDPSLELEGLTVGEFRRDLKTIKNAFGAGSFYYTDSFTIVEIAL